MGKNRIKKYLIGYLKTIKMLRLQFHHWLSLSYPVNVAKSWTRFNFFPGTNGQENFPVRGGGAKISNCACPRDNFPIPVPVSVAKRTIGNPPLWWHLQIPRTERVFMWYVWKKKINPLTARAFFALFENIENLTLKFLTPKLLHQNIKKNYNFHCVRSDHSVMCILHIGT